MNLVEDIQYRGTEYNATEWFQIRQECLMGTLFVSKVFGGFFVSPETVSCHDGSTDRKIEDME